MGKAAAMKWDPESERKLWLSIILELAPSMSSINWDNVNDRVGVEGCTAAACKYVPVDSLFPRDRTNTSRQEEARQHQDQAGHARWRRQDAKEGR